MKHRRGLGALIYPGVFLIFLLVIPTIALQANSPVQHSPRIGPTSYEILLVARQFTPAPGISQGDRLALQGLAQEALAEGRQRIHALVQLDYIPDNEEQDALAGQGILLLEYIPHYAWLAAIPAEDPARVSQVEGVRWLGSLSAADKQDPALSVQDSPWAYDAHTGQAALYVVLHQDVPPGLGHDVLSSYGQVSSYAASANVYVVWMDQGRVQQLLAEDVVSWVQPAEPKLEPINNWTRAWIDSDVLDGASYGDADGTDVDILIYDGGWIRDTHQELSGRVTRRDNNCVQDDHPTHVACTTSSRGGVLDATGHANDMHALLSDCMSTDTGAFYYSDPGELEGDLIYAKDTWSPTGGDSDGAELLNASVGTNTAQNGWPCAWEGNYGPTAVILDNVVRGDTAAGKFIAVWANGNERGSGRCGFSYHTTAPPACAKNPIQVGATNKDADTMTSFSSWGPCDDGRIKPVVSAPGCAAGSSGIYSCLATSDFAYGYGCGTSMASPAVAGVVAQLIEYCRSQGLSYCPASGEFWPSSARALLMHAAVDLGSAGPDYQYGYGRIEADAAADLLTHSPPANDADLRQDQISDHGEIDTYQITVSGSPAQLKVTLAWDDEAAAMQALRKLVNDLDLEVISPGGTIYSPYVLDPDDPGSPATTGVDSLNNQEQVVVSSPADGIWTIRVIGRAVPAAPQDYSIIFPSAYSTVPAETPGATPTPSPTPDPAYCAEYVSNGTFESNTDGWTLMDSAVRSSDYAHTGSYSLRAGGTWDGVFYYDLAVPADMAEGTIRFWYRMQTSESSHPWDFFDVEVRDAASNETLTTLLSTDDSKANAVWAQVDLAIGPDYAGRNIRLHFRADVNGTNNTYWYVDDVSVNLCRYSPTPLPTNTPGPSPTPVPTPVPPSPEPPPADQAPLCADDPAGLLSLPGPLIPDLAKGLSSLETEAGGGVQRSDVTLRLASDEAEVNEVGPGGSGVPAQASEPVPAHTAAQPQAVGPIPNLKVEGMASDSGWVTADTDRQGNLYVAYEYAYASGGSCPPEGCFAAIAGKSRDNGRSWDLWYVWASNASSARRPSIAVDDYGRLYIAVEFYYNPGSGYRWYPAVATSPCPGDVSVWGITYWSTTYALVPGGTAADAGGDGDDVYLEFQVAYQADGEPDLFTVFTTDGGSSWGSHYLVASDPLEAPTVSVGQVNAVCTFSYNDGTPSRVFYRAAVGSGPGRYITEVNDALYGDAEGSGPYHYVVYQRRLNPLLDDNVYVRYSTNDGLYFSSEVVVDNRALQQRYPVVAAYAGKVRLAYIHDTNQTLLRTSDNGGANWSAPYTLNTGGNTTVEGFHYVGLAYQPIAGPPDGKHPLVPWVDNRDSGSGQGRNLYMGSINDPPAAGTLSWPANGETITAFAPALAWNGGSDPDGDPLRYWWYVSTTNTLPESDKVGGAIALTTGLPYYAAPGTTYYWKVRADDGYQTADSAVWRFTTASEVFSGTPLSYTEAFTTNPAYWTRKGFACLDCFEGDPMRWQVSPAGKWVRSSSYHRGGAYSARVLYDANNADYQMTSPPLDLRGSEWAFFNTFFLGSSETGADVLLLESRAGSSSSCWSAEGSLTGDYGGAWWSYYQGNVDLSAYGRTVSSQVRFRFITDGSNYGGGYGIGWYVDEPEVARSSEWSWQGAGSYRLQVSDGAWSGYTDNLVDQFYSPFIVLPNSPSRGIRLILNERYRVYEGDEATVWIRDTAAGTWQQLASYRGLQDSWMERTVPIPNSYKGQTVVLALVLRSDGSGTLGGASAGGGVMEQGGYWEVDRFRLEEYTPTGIKLRSFAAVPVPAGILVTWETASERDNLGFNLYRSLSAEALGERLNAVLIPSKSPGAGQGASYAFRDNTVVPGLTYYYTLEDVSNLDLRTRYGPAVVTLWRAYLPLVVR